jgi:hypothetical protein
MKKLFLLPISLLSLSLVLHAQTAKWFAGFSTGYSIGGPSASLKANMENQDYNQSGVGLFGTISFPSASYIPPLLLMAGKQISDYGSLYILFGRPISSSVEGYNGVAQIYVDYNVLQFTAGYQFTFPNTHFKAGLGPSLFEFSYFVNDYGQTPVPKVSTYRPGLSAMARVPFGKEKRLFGVELFFEMNLAANAKVADISTNVNYETYTLKGSTVSLVYAVAGLTFAFRR